ncbi:unnamed protein product [Mycena citricolor]|uniref:DUF1764-domain-containing protein n=1 Tax=Mycena citricolor TaxID=2018698 RepID=A0AAD2HPB8_9AGAR|nr:unnamed protein product [Mycena citricolor]
MSEIDDIFAKRPLASTSAAPPVDQPKKKKSKKGKVKEPVKDEIENASKSSSSSKKRAAPETVVDTSSRPVPAQKKIKLAKYPPAPVIGKEEENKFTDSRGSGPKRKTEEGWTIYKEDELGIKDEGGGSVPFVSPSFPYKFLADTPLCPFDCDCCF